MHWIYLLEIVTLFQFLLVTVDTIYSRQYFKINQRILFRSCRRILQCHQLLSKIPFELLNIGRIITDTRIFDFLVWLKNGWHVIIIAPFLGLSSDTDFESHRSFFISCLSPFIPVSFRIFYFVIVWEILISLTHSQLWFNYSGVTVSLFCAVFYSHSVEKINYFLRKRNFIADIWII